MVLASLLSPTQDKCYESRSRENKIFTAQTLAKNSSMEFAANAWLADPGSSAARET